MSWFPRMYAQETSQQSQVSSQAQEDQHEITMLNVRLNETREPVWPEDEKVEIATQGGIPVPFIESKEEANAVLHSVTVQLPDCLMPRLSQPSGGCEKTSELASAARDYGHIAFHIPTSYSAPEELVLRRLCLELVFSSADRVTPVVVFMEPASDVSVDVRKLGEVGVDLGKLLSLIPQVPAVFTAKVGTEMDVTKVHPKIQASGLLCHECSWRIADSSIAYNFNPGLIARFSTSHTLTVSATLHVEVRKSILGVFHKTYGKSAQPRLYVYRPDQDLMLTYKPPQLLSEDTRPEMEQAVRQARDRYLAATAGNQDMSESTVSPRQPIEGLGRDEAQQWSPRDISSLKIKELFGGRSASEWLHDEMKIGYQQADEATRRVDEASRLKAMLKLGQLAEGRQDREEAERWYQRAADAGSQDAKKNLKRMHPWKHLIMRHQH